MHQPQETCSRSEGSGGHQKERTDVLGKENSCQPTGADDNRGSGAKLRTGEKSNAGAFTEPAMIGDPEGVSD